MGTRNIETKPPLTTQGRAALHSKLQEHITKANASLDAAKEVADQLGESFQFLERTYTPRKVVVQEVTTGGDWDIWQSSDC